MALTDKEAQELKRQLVENTVKIESQKDIITHIQSMMAQTQTSMDRFIAKITFVLAILAVSTALYGGYQIFFQQKDLDRAISEAREGEKTRDAKFKELIGTKAINSARLENPLGKTDVLYGNPDIGINSIGERAIGIQVRLEFRANLTFEGSTAQKLISIGLEPDHEFVDLFYPKRTELHKEIYSSGTYISMDDMTLVNSVPSLVGFYVGFNVSSCEEAKERISSLIARKSIGNLRLTPIFDVVAQPKATQTFKIEILNEPIIQDCSTLTGKEITLPTNRSTPGTSGNLP